MDKIRYMKNINMFTFAKCGLDIHRNFLQAPECQCGCGAKCLLLMKDRQDVVDTCASLLCDMDCLQCGIFVIMKNGDIILTYRDGDELRSLTATLPVGNCDFASIGSFAVELKLHLYGLMVEENPGEYLIIED